MKTCKRIGKIMHTKIYDLRHYGEHYAWCKSLKACKDKIKTYFELNNLHGMSQTAYRTEIADWDAIETIVFDMEMPKFKYVPMD